MSSMRRLYGAMLLGSLLFALAATACGMGDHDPQITQVRPATVTPGELLMVSGRNFDKADVVWINGQPATRVTWVNDRLLTAVVTPDLPTGAYPLEVRSLDGGRDAVAVNVGGRGPARPPAAAQPTPNPVTPTTQPVAAPARMTTPPPQAATPPRPSTPPALQAVPPHQTPPAAPDVQMPRNAAPAQAQAQVNQTFAQLNTTLAELGLPPLRTPVISSTP